MANAIVVNQSSYDFDETVSRIERAVRDAGNTMFAKIDQAAAAHDVGLTLRPTVVLIFGNPKAGTPLMDASPQFALELPLKVVVWQDEAGTVTVARRSLQVLAATNPLPAKEDALATLDERIGALLDNALH